MHNQKIIIQSASIFDLLFSLICCECLNGAEICLYGADNKDKNYILLI